MIMTNYLLAEFSGLQQKEGVAVTEEERATVSNNGLFSHSSHPLAVHLLQSIVRLE